MLNQLWLETRTEVWVEQMWPQGIRGLPSCSALTLAQQSQISPVFGHSLLSCLSQTPTTAPFPWVVPSCGPVSGGP